MNRGPPSTTIVSPVLPCMALFRSSAPAPPSSGPARWRRLPAPPSSFRRSISWVRPMAIVVVFDKPCVGKSRQSGLHDGQFADARVIVGELRLPHLAEARPPRALAGEIGRASCRERVVQYG